ncbi:MAG: transposase [Vicinamibacterales bacterium]
MSKAVGVRRTRRQCSEEFKEGAVRLVLDEGKTVGAVARELDLTASALGLWVQQGPCRADQGQERADEGRARGADAPAQGSPEATRGARPAN